MKPTMFPANASVSTMFAPYDRRWMVFARHAIRAWGFRAGRTVDEPELSVRWSGYHLCSGISLGMPITRPYHQRHAEALNRCTQMTMPVLHKLMATVQKRIVRKMRRWNQLFALTWR